jgi:hypothetical protein
MLNLLASLTILVYITIDFKFVNSKSFKQTEQEIYAENHFNEQRSLMSQIGTLCPSYFKLISEIAIIISLIFVMHS